MNSLKELSPMIPIIFAICTAVWAIYKFIHEYSSKQRNHDANQLVKFFSTEEKIIEFKKQPEYVKDAIIKNISYLKGHPFSEIEYLLSNKDITLLELRSLLQLKKNEHFGLGQIHSTTEFSCSISKRKPTECS